MLKRKIKLLLGGIVSAVLVATPAITLSCEKDKPEPQPIVIDGPQMTSNLGISIAKEAINQSNVEPDTVVDALKTAPNWEAVLSLFKHYGIKYNTNEAPSGVTYSVNPSTHAHDDEGIIHLDITQTSSTGESQTARFTISGFEKTPVLAEYTLGNYKLSSNLIEGIAKPDGATLIEAIKTAQKAGFEQLLTKLKEYVTVTKIDENNNTSAFEFDLEDIENVVDRGQVHFEKVLLYNTDTPDQKTAADTNYIIQGLKTQ